MMNAVAMLRSASKLAVRQKSATARRSLAAAAEGEHENLVKTALYDLHKELGGNMVPFAGYELPVLYKGSENGGIKNEHLWCRAEGKASLFDVSHMGQVRPSVVRVCCIASLVHDDGSCTFFCFPQPDRRYSTAYYHRNHWLSTVFTSLF